jgi:hypothetical protein
MTNEGGAAPLTTITLCSYRGGARFWAFNKMGSAPRALKRVPGLRFWKLLGTGRGQGFTLRPDLSRYGLLGVWETAAAADDFFAHARLMQDYRQHAHEVFTVRLRAFQAHGAWSGGNPFLPLVAPPPPAAPVAVLTRARIRLSQLAAFWRAVPATTRALEKAPGLLVSIGIGEIPFTHPATFSIWHDGGEMRRFAYGTSAHREVIRRRAAEAWYSEELFARFSIVASEGTWGGRNPLALHSHQSDSAPRALAS